MGDLGARLDTLFYSRESRFSLMQPLTTIAVILGVLLSIVIAGVTGLLFRVWPTSLPDSDLVVTPRVIENLRALRGEPKFGPDPKRFYPGVLISTEL